MNIVKTQEEAVKEHLVSCISLIKDLSRNLKLEGSNLEFAIEQFNKPVAEMNIKELALLNEMLIGACLKQIA
ncbi:hypothetical protein [Acinetobacter sp. ANC 4648]|uniref:hypothetical protein n=1 Tax=Acinetobacter sp. ANC 4648 TaxID=1977875 RepID=UPI000A32B2F6|nr:hypothetical protein [Acinetobacter sp. ANC 4648]OTG81514.1 hypothetical protein B9T27_09505 [Acinetobacter sp. ANC 4648]